MPDAGRYALVTAILPPKYENDPVGIHCLIWIVLAIDNALLFRWDESPSAKLGDMRSRQHLITLQPFSAGLSELH